MLISKFDLYGTEWLDLVFENRNKDYGAYSLRQHYAGTMLKAMAITFSALLLSFGAFFILRGNPVTERRIAVDITPPLVLPPLVAPPKKIDPPKLIKPLKLEVPAKPVTTTKDLVMVPVQDKLADNPVKNEDLKGAIGPATTKGTGTDINVIIDEPANGGSVAPVADESIHLPNGLDFMPEPVGGVSAWAKFLNKNLRFPAEAQEQQVGGRVILSFVVEKDGHLSGITVERSAGYGFDEEAVRVLKLAKAWKPGLQNGQPVRVKYTIPINFQYSENN